jgi:hypothetical protein
MIFDRSIFDDIDTNVGSLEIDEIKKRLDLLLIGIKIETPVFNPGTFLYRARKIDQLYNKRAGIKYSDLIYPPKDRARLGRLNREGQSVFYCSMHKESVLYELQGLQAGDEIILTFWKTNKTMLVNNIGYTEYVFQKLGAKRPVPQWKAQPQTPDSSQATIDFPKIPPEIIEIAMSDDVIRELRETFSKYFMRTVGPMETDNYKLTAAIGELHLGNVRNHEMQFAGILYPSVQTWANGDNLALLPWFVDQHLQFRKALHIRVDDRTNSTFRISYVDFAREFDGDGKLVWLGRNQKWELQPGRGAKFKFEAGCDEDGDYQISAEGLPAHWTAVDSDTGHLINAF